MSNEITKDTAPKKASRKELDRLKEAIKGKTAVNQKSGGKVQTVSVVEVSPRDVLTACLLVRDPTKRVAALLSGNANAEEDSPNVYLHVGDVQHLIEEADKA